MKKIVVLLLMFFFTISLSACNCCDKGNDKLCPVEQEELLCPVEHDETACQEGVCERYDCEEKDNHNIE